MHKCCPAMAGGAGQRVWRAHFSAVSEEAVIGLTLTLTLTLILTLTTHLSPFTLTFTLTSHLSPLTLTPR